MIDRLFQKTCKITKERFGVKWIFFCFFFFCCSYGSTISASITKEALSNKDDSAQPLSAKPINRIGSFVLSPHALQDLLKKGEGLVLIDVRSSEEFQKVRIPESLNIPLFTLKTKEFLRSKSLVIFNDGMSYRGLEEECKELNKYGFQSVHILYGGLNYWRKINGSLEGDFFDIGEIGNISPAQYFVDRNYADWFVIDVSERVDKSKNDLMSTRVNIPYSGNDEKFKKEFEKVFQKENSSLLHYVLIVNNDGQNYNKIKQAIEHDSDIKNIFYLRGGMVEYEKYLKKQTAFLRSDKKIVKKCGSCP